MKFILIAWLLSGPSNFAPVTSAVFDDKPACESALKEIALAFPSDTKGAPGVCVAQSTDEPAPVAKAPSNPVAAVPAKRAP